jgi:preprotein translocase subunit SecA
MSSLLSKPGIRLGSYPQKAESRLTDLEQSFASQLDKLQHKFDPKTQRQNYIVRRVNKYQLVLKKCSENELTQVIQDIRNKLHRQGLKNTLIIKAFAIIREVANRTIGLRHYDVQVFGGWIMMNGMLAEMETGEGKTLATTLPACTAALAGIPVHVITANDYLAARDSETMKPLYQRLGLSSGSVIEGMETEQRQAAYLNDIVHTTNKQITFDYLRDRISMGDNTGSLCSQFKEIQRQHENKEPLLLRGLCFALVDEADSILIDEAKTPLIITKTIANEDLPETFNDALFLASALFIHKDFTANNKTRQIELTSEGEAALDKLTENLPKLWKNIRKREMLVKQALSAEYFYKRNKHYVINEEKIQIVDEYTGRVMSDRSWEQGLHQMIEAKEGCLLSEPREPLARISYQRFFARYLRLGGTSGTLNEVSSELQQVYGLHVVKVATNKISKRLLQMENIYRNETVRKQIFLSRIKTIHQQQRPILIGTSSVEESEQVSQWLTTAGFLHRVLNANQNQHEAEIIAQAGQLKAITVATNMAGRGTDIMLGAKRSQSGITPTPSVAKLGGLHVIALSRNESRRIDRQLYGRCARQGDPGSTEAILSLQDPALANFYSSAMLKMMVSLCPGDKPIPKFIGNIILRLPQQKNEKEQRRIRKLLLKQDRHLQRILAFSGKFE